MIKTEATAVGAALELLAPRFPDLCATSSGLRVRLALSESLDVQLSFPDLSVVKEVECINFEEGCPRCKFQGLLRGLAVLQQHDDVDISGIYVVNGERNYSTLQLQVQVRDAAKVDEFEFVQCHLEPMADSGETARAKRLNARQSSCHVVGCRLHRWKRARTRVSLAPTLKQEFVKDEEEATKQESSVTIEAPTRSAPSSLEHQEQVVRTQTRRFNLPNLFHSLMARTEDDSMCMWGEHVPNLELTLYEHQRRGISWMLQREQPELWDTVLPHPFSAPGVELDIELEPIGIPFVRNEVVGYLRLQHLLRRIMIRHTKESIRDKLPHPVRHTAIIAPTPSEYKLYNGIAASVRANLVLAIIDPDTPGNAHPDSLLNPKNRKAAMKVETNLVLASTGGFYGEWTVDVTEQGSVVQRLRASGVAIVFSQFRECIWRTRVALKQQDIVTADFIALISAKERIEYLAEFRSDPDVNVLLLSNLGSHGLDLSFVTHIFLLEEIYDKSVEQQVISRAHRMGANQSVVVEQLWMKGSVECESMQGVSQDEFEGTTSTESRQQQPTRGEVQEASSADKSSFQQVRVNFVLSNLRVLGEDVVAKDGEVCFSVQDEVTAIIRQGVHVISEEGGVTTVSTMPVPPPPQLEPPAALPSAHDSPEIIEINDSSPSDIEYDYGSDAIESDEEDKRARMSGLRDNTCGVKVEDASSRLSSTHEKQVYIEISGEETESE
ncbi:hypothetical protein PHYBOEH_009286 [Phytophthora boehmeriae]|uniref:Helicase C-terminal domain-containing protein n=1 Tax=Phytophthora boehmeriae TaxID=109152 RepID=A0A8T1WZB3_9STRA|nr:hypothetical protein PHYBOEH_009286 [Phytophthora boehmeriae]